MTDWRLEVDLKKLHDWRRRRRYDDFSKHRRHLIRHLQRSPDTLAGFDGMKERERKEDKRD